LMEGMGAAKGVRHARKHVAAYAEDAARRGFAVEKGELAAILQENSPERVMAFLARLHHNPSPAGIDARARNQIPKNEVQCPA
jgi:tRNA-dihydrouridine synthase B